MATTSAQPSAAVQAAGAASLTIKPIQAALGAEIICGDVRALDARQSQLIKQAWLDHLVLLFRGQSLNDDELVAFAQRFGKLSHPVAGHQLHGNVETFRHPHVNVVSNVVENGVPIGTLGDGEAFWHSDFSFEEVPYAATLLHSHEIPADGSGNTGFINMYLAYETLPRDLRERLEDQVRHALRGPPCRSRTRSNASRRKRQASARSSRSRARYGRISSLRARPFKLFTPSAFNVAVRSAQNCAKS